VSYTAVLYILQANNGSSNSGSTTDEKADTKTSTNGHTDGSKLTGDNVNDTTDNSDNKQAATDGDNNEKPNTTDNSNGSTTDDTTTGGTSKQHTDDTTGSKHGTSAEVVDIEAIPDDHESKQVAEIEPTYINVDSAPRCVGPHATEAGATAQPTVVTVKTQPANGTTQTIHLSVVRGKTPIEDKTKKHNVLNKVFDGVGNNKVVKSAINKAQREMDKVVRIEGDGKGAIKNPDLRFIGKKWTNHLTRNGKQRTFSNAGIDPIAAASVNIRAGIKQQVDIQLPQVDALREGDSVYLAVFVTDGDSSVVGSAAWRERLSNPDAAYYYDISTDTDCKLAEMTSDIENMINSDGNIVNKMDAYSAKMQL
jgi:hypothetical protein